MYSLRPVSSLVRSVCAGSPSLFLLFHIFMVSLLLNDAFFIKPSSSFLITKLIEKINQSRNPTSPATSNTLSSSAAESTLYSSIDKQKATNTRLLNKYVKVDRVHIKKVRCFDGIDFSVIIVTSIFNSSKINT